jgi:hypothetical protein
LKKENRIMEKGIAIISVAETGTQSVFIDQDVIECARLNAKTKKRIAKAEARQREIQHKARATKKANDRRKAYRINAIKHLAIHAATCGAVIWLGLSGLVSPAICIPVAVFHLCGACVRLGAWFGRGARA